MNSKKSTSIFGKSTIGNVAAYALLGVVGTAMMSQPALAQAAGDPTGVIESVIDIILGGWGKAAAVLAIIIAGVMCLGGRLNLAHLFTICVGIGLIFGATWGVDALTGGA